MLPVTATDVVLLKKADVVLLKKADVVLLKKSSDSFPLNNGLSILYQLQGAAVSDTSVRFFDRHVCIIVSNEGACNEVQVGRALNREFSLLCAA